MADRFKISQPWTDLLIMRLALFTKINPAIFVSILVEEQGVTTEYHFGIISSMEMRCMRIEQGKLFRIDHLMALILSWKTKRASFGLAQGVKPSCMMEKHLLSSLIKASLL